MEVEDLSNFEEEKVKAKVSSQFARYRARNPCLRQTQDDIKGKFISFMKAWIVQGMWVMLISMPGWL